MRFIYILFLIITSFSFSQSETKLKKQLQKEFKEMQAQGASFQDIHKQFSRMNSSEYILSLEDFLRNKIFLEYMYESFVATKLEEGTLTEEDETLIKFTTPKYKTYQEYLDYKKTPEAMEKWGNNIDDGVLKLAVSNIDNYNEHDKKRYNDLKGLFDRDLFFTSFVITDGTNTKIITRNN